VTAQSTLLPRPVFRTYQREIGEAVAVERATSHALVVVLKSEHARVKLGVNHPVMPPHADQQSANECDCQPANNHSKVKDVFQHGSPHDAKRRPKNAAVRSEEQAGADGYAVNGGHGSVLERVKVVEERAEPQPNIDAYNPLVIDCRPQNTNSEHCASKSTSPVPAPQPTQHLRLRVVWQGLL